MRSQHWIAVVLVLLLLLGAAYVILNFLVGSYLSPGQVKRYLETVSGREARVGSVSFSVWSGIRVDQVELSRFPDWNNGTFMTSKFITLTPDLWALLSGRFVVSSARVGGVEIQVYRQPSGRWNLGQGFAAGDGDTSPRREIPFAIRDLSFVEGKIRFRDQVVDRDIPLSFHRIRLEDYRPGQGGLLHVDNLVLPRGNLVGKVRFQLREPSLEVTDFRLNYVSLDTLRPYLKRLLPPPLESIGGTLNARLEKLTVDPQGVRGSGQLTLDELRVGEEADFPVTNLSLSGDASLDRATRRLRADLGDLQLNKQLLVQRMEGRLGPPWNNPFLEVRLDLGGVRVDTLVEWAARFGYQPVPGDWSLSGRFATSELTVSGTLFDPGFGGTATLSNMVLRGPGIPGEWPLESVNVALTETGLEVGSARLVLAGERLSLRGAVRTDVPLANSRLDLNLDGSGIDAAFLQRVLEQWTTRLPNVTVSGELTSFGLNLTGSLQEPTWSARGVLGGVDLGVPLVPGPLTDLTGEWAADAGGLELRGIEGQYENHAFNLAGWLPWRVDRGRALSLRGNLLHFPGERLRSLLPGGIWPQGLILRGPTSVRELRVQGPFERLSWEGVIEPERVRIEHGRLKDPIKEVRGEVQWEGRRIPPRSPGGDRPGAEGDTGAENQTTGPPSTPQYRMRFRGSLEGSYRGNPAAVGGSFPYPIGTSAPFRLNGHAQDLPLELFNPMLRRLWDGEELVGTGPLTINEVTVEGPMENLRVQGDFEFGGVRMESSLFPHPLEAIRGRLRLQPPGDGVPNSGQRPLIVETGLEAQYRQNPVRVEGRFPYPLSAPGEYDLLLSATQFPLEPLLRVVPGGTVSEQDLSGRVTLRDLRITGSLPGLRPEGEVQVSGVRVRPPFLRAPVEGLSGQIQLRGDVASIERLKGQWLDRPLELEGRLRREGPTWNPELVLRIDGLPVRQLLGGLKTPPFWPPALEPEGTVSFSLSVEGTLKRPRLRGDFHAPDFSVGGWGSGEARGKWTYEQGGLSIDFLRLPLLGGEYRGEFGFREGEGTSRVQLEGQVQSLELGQLLERLGGIGRNSSGRINGSLSGSAPADQLNRFTGSVNLEGTKLVFRDIEALKRLSVLLNTNLTRVIETGLTRALLNLLTLNIKRSKQRIDSLFGTKITTHYDEAHAQVDFEQGRGTVRQLHFSNSEIRIRGRGGLWLDGRLDLRLDITPRRNLLNRIEETLLRSLITGGFPSLRITGTLQEPRFDESELRKGLQNQLLGLVSGKSAPDQSGRNGNRTP